MIQVGAKVRCRHKLVVNYYGSRSPDEVPEGSIGVVRYRPVDEDPKADFQLGASWTRPDGTECGIEVLEDEVDLVLEIGKSEQGNR